MALKTSDIFQPMVQAATHSLGKDWPKVRDYAEPEFKKLAQSMIDILQLVAEEKVNKAQAKALLQIHANTTKMIMLTVEGMGLLAVENAVNAALKVARGIANTALGITVF